MFEVKKDAHNIRSTVARANAPATAAGRALMSARDASHQFSLINAGRKNLIINGEFKVNCRNITSIAAVPSGNNTKYTADRWVSYSNSVTTAVSIQEVVLPNGVKTNSHKTVANAAIGSGGWLHPFQAIETFGCEWLAGKMVTLSCWVRTNMHSQKMRICDTYTCYSLGETIPSDGEWHYMHATHKMPDEDSMGTGVNNYIQFHPSFVDSASSGYYSGDYIEFALPQFELGQVPTPFEHRTLAEETKLCQRYAIRLGGNPGDNVGHYNAIGAGWWRNTTQAYAVQLLVNLPTTMRNADVTGTVDGTNSFYVQGGTASTTAIFRNVNNNGSSPHTLWMDFEPAAASGLAPAVPCMVGSATSISEANGIIVDAEFF